MDPNKVKELKRELEDTRLKVISLTAYFMDCQNYISTLSYGTYLPGVACEASRCESLRYYQREVDKTALDIQLLESKITYLEREIAIYS